MKKCSVPLVALLLFPVISLAQNASRAGENALQPVDDSVRHQTQKPSPGTLVFPDYVDGAGWSVQLALSNVARRSGAAVVVTTYGQEGQPVPELFDSETAFEIPPLGSRVLRSSGSGAVRRGWIEVRSEPPAVRGLLTYSHSETGAKVGVAAVTLGDRFALFVEESDDAGSGLALFKPDPDSRIEFQIRDEMGHDPLGKVLTWGDFQQSARTFSEWFDVDGVEMGFLRDFKGLLLLRAEDGSGFAPLGLRFGKRTGALSAIPLIRDRTHETEEMTLVFPDYVDGNGWSVQLALSNVAESAAAEVEVTAYDQAGRRIELFDSEARLEIPPLGSRVLRSTGAGEIRRGWIQVRTGTPGMSGSLIYSHSGTREEVGVAPVELGDHFALFVEESSEVGTGLAIFKPEASPRIEFRIRDEAGRDPLNDVFLPWRGFRQSARTISEWFDVDSVEAGFLQDFRGLLFLRTEDGSPFAPMGLRFGKGTRSLSAVPGIWITGGVSIDGGVEIEGGVGIDGGGRVPPPTVTLSAAPNSIEWGQSATLKWSSTNAERMEIRPGIGEVATAGTRKVSPRTTTTYRITVWSVDGQTATASVKVTVAISERAALEALYQATDGPNWLHNDNWLTDAPLTEWYGVDVDGAGRVISLRFFERKKTENEWASSIGNRLSGSIPPELGSLNYLRVLIFNSNNLSGSIPAELGQLSNLRTLDLGNNRFTGEIPPELSNLSNLRHLSFNGNRLTGPIPPVFSQLDQLNAFWFSDNDGLCAPGTSDFLAWLEQIEHSHKDPHCNESDVAALKLLYRTAGGAYWRNSDGWLRERALSEWYGVRVDTLARVTGLDLTDNGLRGRLPNNLGQLTQMTELRIGSNALSGRLPIGLTRLPLQEFHYANTKLCAPIEERFQAWLSDVPSHEGTGVKCAPLSDRDFLVALYDVTNGQSWLRNNNWVTRKHLGSWYGVDVDNRGRVIGLDLRFNNLDGPIPLELAELSDLVNLDLNENDLTGSIPPEIGRLSRLRNLDLGRNRLRGSIPPEIGDLSRLQTLLLDNNYLRDSVPPEIGRMSRLRVLRLMNNARMSGALPSRLTSLRQLDTLMAWGTNLCAPSDARFQTWLNGVRRSWVAHCSGEASTAYLIQAVQLRQSSVPLIAGDKALLRVFVSAPHADGETVPPVQARFYVDGRETHVVDIPGHSAPISAGVDEESLWKSTNAVIPGEVVQPGLEMVVEIDPEGTLGSSLGLTKRIPETGRLAVEVRAMPTFDLTLIPFLLRHEMDWSIPDIVEDIAEDPEGHELLRDTQTLLPIGDLDVKAHDPVLSSSKDLLGLFHEVEAIHAMEGARGHYMGIAPNSAATALIGGYGAQPGKSSVALPAGSVMAHELGHNLDLRHAPCGDPDDTDPLYPEFDGSIDAWGYDFQIGQLVPPTDFDLMSYCGPGWIGDYHFTKALRYRLRGRGRVGFSAPVATSGRSLLLWGGADAGGVPFLEPAFVVDAPPLLPRAAGDYEIVGQTAAGDELFFLAFEMPEVADGDGRLSFAFALPVQPEWAGRLAAITLSGPAGSARLDRETDRPVTILRNPRTGQIRGILRERSNGTLARDNATSALVLDEGLEVLTSRGLPDPEDWNR